jgi:protein phosphatase
MTILQSNEAFGGAPTLTDVRTAVCMLLGQKRKRQEDCAYISDDLVIVADGMGGQADGDKASALAVTATEKYLHAEVLGLDATGQVTAAFMAASDAVLGISEGRTRTAPAATMLVGLRTGEHEMVVGHIGDSRIYSYSAGSLMQLTTAHENWDGSISRYLGWGSNGYPDTFTVMSPEGGRLILATDGLFGMISDERIALLCKNHENETALDLAKALAHDANDAGGHDNVTVAVVEL